MTARLLQRLAIVALSFGCAATASAAPVLKADIVVTSDVVTVGDMFDQAGIFAEQPLFRAPAAGTAGLVDIGAVRTATALVGLTAFNDEGLLKVRVVRSGTTVDAPMLTKLIEADLRARGMVENGVTVNTTFESALPAVTAASVASPVQLMTMRYLPSSGSFSARFVIAGLAAPLDVSGRIDLMLAAPHLISSLQAGAILTPQDIEMRPESVAIAQAAGAASVDQLVGKQLQRQSHAGMLLHLSDVAEPNLVARNDAVIVYLRSGAMTLSVKGQALNTASKGQPVAVLNLTSKKVLHGTALAAGAVEISTDPMGVAGL
jgi:flagella basal body P-ring formation protein FlgA